MLDNWQDEAHMTKWQRQMEWTGSHQSCWIAEYGAGMYSLGLETFFGTSRLVSGLKVERLGLEDITFRSRDFSLVNIHAMHQACGYITKKIMDMTRKKQVVKWQTSPVGVFKLRHCGLDTFFGTSRSWRLNVSSRLSLESLEKWNVSVSSRSWGFNVSVLWLNVLRTSLVRWTVVYSVQHKWVSEWVVS